MEQLARLDRGGPDRGRAAWYALRGGAEPGLERYVVSTPGTRRICNRPELLGLAYTDTLRESMTAALVTAPFCDLLRDAPEERLCVLHLLRGGLNFGLREALGRALGANRQASAFMSSQRRVEGGRWGVSEDGYRKLDIPRAAVLLVGDIVATGVTLEHGLEVARGHLQATGAAPRAMVFFTIGGPRAEEVLGGAHRALRATFPAYERTCLVYIEGRFALASEDSPLRIREPGTDLLRRGALLAPEFALSQYETPSHALERCSIYDAGSRAFAIPEYAHDVVDYWERVRGLARDGLTLREALLERWPEGAPAEGPDARWTGADPALLGHLIAAREAAWEALAAPAAGDAVALAALCDARIRAVQDAAGLPGGTR